jgi:very-short-patch-repair endonuclease
MTDAEQALWKSLRMRQMAEAKFRRQQPIGPYIVDFVSFGSSLVVEADGGQHTRQADYDAKRTAWLEGQGFRVLRFWDHEVLQAPDAVKRVIWEALTPPPQSSPTRGEEVGEGGLPSEGRWASGVRGRIPKWISLPPTG